ncbi:MAG: phosphotransferase [Acidimicrobiales bacterium]
MQTSRCRKAVAAAVSTASALDLRVEDAVVLQDSTRVTVRLIPCDVVARIAPLDLRASAELEVELARRLVEIGSPVVALEPRVEPRVYVRDGFVMNMWTYHESRPPREHSRAGYAQALGRLHAGMRQIDLATPHFTDRVADAQRLVGSRELTPALADADRELLCATLRDLARTIGERAAAEQMLHGEPHPGNVLGTNKDLLFIDLETCCRGPVELDVAYVPEEVSEHYPDADQELLGECRALTLAVVAAWRWDRDDHYPNGLRAGRALLDALRGGPPWPTIDAAWRRPGDP